MFATPQILCLPGRLETWQKSNKSFVLYHASSWNFIDLFECGAEWRILTTSLVGHKYMIKQLEPFQPFIIGYIGYNMLTIEYG